MTDRIEAGQQLLDTIKAKLPELEALLAKLDTQWYGDDHVYRFFHTSFKVFRAQESIHEIVDALQELAPERSLNRMFAAIIEEGTSGSFSMERTNPNWEKETRPIVEAYFHAQHMLRMVVKAAKEIDQQETIITTGWGTVLHLYGIR